MKRIPIDKDWLKQKYCCELMSTVEIGKMLGVSQMTVYKRLKEYGIQPRKKGFVRPGKRRSGAKHHNWKGGKYVDGDGYVLVLCREHPCCTNQGYVREHRLVVEKHLGRFLTEEEVVHHKDGDRLNNDLSNLEILTVAQHTSLTFSGEQSHTAKLKEAQVKQILKDKEKSSGCFAKKFGVNRSTIKAIRSGKTWKDVER